MTSDEFWSLLLLTAIGILLIVSLSTDNIRWR